MTDTIDQIIEENARARAELIEAIDALPVEGRLEGWFGSELWSVKDVLAHIARWQEGWGHALQAIAAGERPSVPGYVPNSEDVDAADAAYNADSIAEMSAETWDAVLIRLRDAREQHEEAIRGLRVLDPERYAEGRAARRLADSANHDREHSAPILARRWESSSD